MKEFIKYSGILKDFIIHKSIIDYEEIFNNLPAEVVEDLDILTEYYYNYLSTEIQNTSILSIKIQSIKSIDGLPIIFNLYLTKNFRPFFSNATITNKIGLNISLPTREYISKNNMESLQNIHLLNCDIEDEDTFKNYIYNILFYAHIIVKHFKFDPLLRYLNHIDDIDDLIHIQELHLRLFGTIEECSVCLEPTITKTICNHVICQKCYCCLSKKVCPICRKVLYNDIEDIEYIQFLIS